MRKQFTSSFKAQVARELLREEKTLAQVSSEYSVAATQLSAWKAKTLKGLPSLFDDEHRTVETVKAHYELKVQELYGEIGRLTTQLAWLKKKSGLDMESQ